MHSVGINGGVVSPLILLVALFVITTLLILSYKVFKPKTRVYNTWACGYKTSPKTQYSATGFAGPIRRFFSWLYKPNEHLKKEPFSGYKTKFFSSEYQVHVSPLFEKVFYKSLVKGTNYLSYWVYRLAHFEQTRYTAMIFNILLFVLFTYRIFLNDFSWGTFMLEFFVMFAFVKILLVGNKK